MPAGAFVGSAFNASGGTGSGAFSPGIFICQVVFVTVTAFLLFLQELGRWTASGTSYGFVLIPLIRVVLATTLAGEQITPGFVMGAVLVLLGVWFGALLPDKKIKNRSEN